MIYTVTLNPSLDRVVWVNEIKEDDSNRINEEKYYAGGKGIDVSRVIKTLGGDTTATGFIGSFNGLHLEGLLIIEGVTCDFVKIQAETRSNVIVFSKDLEHHLSFNSKGPEVSPYDIASLFNKIINLSVKPSYVVISGSLPKGVPTSFYAQIIHTLKEQNIKVALDSDNEPLQLAIKENPFLIKPNIHEYSRLIGFTPQTEEEIIQSGQGLLEQGIEIILVSRGADGLVVFNKEQAYSIKSPEIEVKSTIGSGDSALAAFMLGLEKGKPIDACGIMAAAAGASTAMSPGVELISMNDYQSLIPQVKCTKIKESACIGYCTLNVEI